MRNIKTGLLLIFVMLSFAQVCCATEAVVDYVAVLPYVQGYEVAHKQYDAFVTDEKSRLALQIKMAKSEAEKQQLIETYVRSSKQQRYNIFNPLISKMADILQQIAKEKGYTKIYAKGHGNGIDITQQAIDRLKLAQTPTLAVGKVTAGQNVAKDNTQPVTKAVIQNADKTEMKVEVQFGAGYDKELIHGTVARAIKNGIENAYVMETKDNKGRTLWRARAGVKTMSEAYALCTKLSRMRLKNFIVK